MLFSHVKISSFRAKAHLVFHWCLCNKIGWPGKDDEENSLVFEGRGKTCARNIFYLSLIHI